MRNVVYNRQCWRKDGCRRQTGYSICNYCRICEVFPFHIQGVAYVQRTYGLFCSNSNSAQRATGLVLIQANRTSQDFPLAIHKREFRGITHPETHSAPVDWVLKASITVSHAFATVNVVMPDEPALARCSLAKGGSDGYLYANHQLRLCSQQVGSAGWTIGFRERTLRGPIPHLLIAAVRR